jgi:mannose-6-phosphate isomerase
MTPSACDFPPLLFKPIFKEKIWGGRTLEHKLNKKIPPGKRIGESWELSAVPGDESLAQNGPFAEKPLSFIFASEKERLVGNRRFHKFPLLYKFIDTDDKLSLQVHPADQEQGGETISYGKTECWYIVDAKPGAQLIFGFQQNVGLKDVRDAVVMERLPQLCNYVSVKPGDVVFVPPKIVHALLDGLLIYEIQQTSDATFRLFDWRRPASKGIPRPLHISEALQTLDIHLHPEHIIKPVVCTEEKGVRHSVRIACRYFALEEYCTDASSQILLGPKDSFRVVTTLEGMVEISGLVCHERISKGETALIPACQGAFHLCTEGPAHFLISYVPEIASDSGP